MPFEEGDKDVVKQFGGSELGVAISKAIVDAHCDGKDLGAAFTARLRLADELRMHEKMFEK
jgi:hypothetical protein